MDPLLQFSQIKILKNKVEVTPCPIEDMDNNTWNIGTIDTKKEASPEMILAMDSLITEVSKRMFSIDDVLEYIPDKKARKQLQEDIHSKIKVHGITLIVKSGLLGVKIHFKIDNQKWFNSTLNGHLPTIFECSGDIDELDEESKKVYMDQSLKSKVQAICEATIEYLKIRPKPEQLSLFALPEAENAE